MLLLISCHTFAGTVDTHAAPTRRAPELGGQYVLVDGALLQKPCILTLTSTTVSKTGKVESHTFQKQAHVAKTLLITGGREWTVNVTMDASRASSFACTYRIVDSKTVELSETGCGKGTYHFSYDGSNLVLDEGKAGREVYKRL